MMGRASPMFSSTAASSRLSSRSRISPVILAEVMPTTCPWPFTSAPPEFPGFRAAEVWIMPMPSLFTSLSRSRAETMPSVMEPVR